MTANVPAIIDPLTAPDCDCQGLPFMPLEVSRVQGSDLTALSTGDEFKAAVLLWCASWNQVPAASLPDEDRILARMTGYGLSEWKALRDMALKGWIKCSDGRLYHPLIADLATKAFAKRKGNSDRANSRWSRAKAGKSAPEMPRHNKPDATVQETDAAAMQGTGTVKVDADASTTRARKRSLGSKEIDELVERLWAHQPIIGGKRRATRPEVRKALVPALDRGGAPADIEGAFVEFYALPECRRDAGRYAMGAAVLLHDDKWRDFIPAQPLSIGPAGRFPEPEVRAAAITAGRDEAWCASWLDPCAWDAEHRTIIPRTNFAAGKLRQELGPVLRGLGVRIEERAA